MAITTEDLYNAFIQLPNYQNIPTICELDIDKLQQMNSEVWSPRFTEGTQNSTVASLHGQGKKAITWTVNIPEQVYQYLTEGIFDGMLTDYPAQLAFYYYGQNEKYIIVLFAFLFLSNTGFTQNADSLYRLTAYGGFGYVRNISSFDYEFPGLNKNGLLGNIKIMWEPEYLIHGGIEVGRSDLYSVDQSNIPTDSGSTNLQTDLYSWTFMFVFSMSPLANFEINAGTGWGVNTVNNTACHEDSPSTEAGSVCLVSELITIPFQKS
jgi:hypothetical protein